MLHPSSPWLAQRLLPYVQRGEARCIPEAGVPSVFQLWDDREACEAEFWHIRSRVPWGRSDTLASDASTAIKRWLWVKRNGTILG